MQGRVSSGIIVGAVILILVSVWIHPKGVGPVLAKAEECEVDRVDGSAPPFVPVGCSEARTSEDQHSGGEKNRCACSCKDESNEVVDYRCKADCSGKCACRTKNTQMPIGVLGFCGRLPPTDGTTPCVCDCTSSEEYQKIDTTCRNSGGFSKQIGAAHICYAMCQFECVKGGDPTVPDLSGARIISVGTCGRFDVQCLPSQ
jgi:hypothetical protein